MINKVLDLLRPAYYSCKDIFDFQGTKMLKKNIVLYDMHLGKRIFLLFTGESIQRIDITKLKNEYTSGTQFIFLHEEISKVNLNFYVSVEPNRSFHSKSPSWKKPYLELSGHERIKTFYREIGERLGNETKLILHSDNYKYIEANNLLKDRTKYFVKGKKDLHVIEGVPYKIIADLTKRRISGGGTVFFSILIMMYMGFKEIYLCGAGYTYEPIYMLHFYDNFAFPKNMAVERAEIDARKAIDDLNRKIGDTMEYYGLFEKDNFYRSICVNRVDCNPNMDTHRILNNYAKSQRVKIYNIVPDGFESPVYEKIAWEEVERKILPGNPKGVLS